MSEEDPRYSAIVEANRRANEELKSLGGDGLQFFKPKQCQRCGGSGNEPPARKPIYKPAQKRPTVSVSGATYRRLKDYAEKNGVTISSVVEALLWERKR